MEVQSMELQIVQNAVLFAIYEPQAAAVRLYLSRT